MSSLSTRDRELVAIGAAMGSNCVPCIEYHIPESRKAGLTDDEIRTAVHLADKIRQVPARKTLDAALGKLQSTQGDAANAGTGPSGGGDGAGCHAGGPGGEEPARPMAMFGMMSRAMSSRCGQAHSSKPPTASGERTSVPAAGEECGCGEGGG